MKEPMFIASLEVQKLCTAFAESYIGQLFTYKYLSSLINKDVQTEARSILVSARKITQRELGFVFGTVYGQGLKRLSDIEIVQTGGETVVKIRRTSRRGAERIAHAAPEKLPVETRIQQNMYLSVLAMVHSTMTEKRLKKLEERVAQAESRLPLDKTLDAFRDEI